MGSEFLRRRVLVTLLLFCLGLPEEGLASEEGVWLNVEEDSLGQGEEGGWFDIPPDTTRTGFFDDYFPVSDLDFRSRNLQDLLRENLLLEEENERLTEIFRADSTLALALYQLRTETFPRFHALSDLWVYIWRGRGLIVVNEEEEDYGPGQFIQIPAGALHSLRNISGAPTVGLVWQRPPLVDSLTVEFIPEDVLEQMRADSLREIDLQERSLYKQR